MALAVLTFCSHPSDDMNAIEVLAVVDGTRFTELVTDFETGEGWDPAGGYGGLFPGVFRLGAADDYWFGTGSPSLGSSRGRIWALGCECGELGCWPFALDVTTTRDTVVWQNFGQPFRPERDYTGFGPFTFDRGQYEAAVASVANLFVARM